MSIRRPDINTNDYQIFNNNARKRTKGNFEQNNQVFEYAKETTDKENEWFGKFETQRKGKNRFKQEKNIETINTTEQNVKATRNNKNRRGAQQAEIALNEQGNMDLTQMLSKDELAIVEKNNLDLDAVVEIDGKYYPKYLIARGKSDGQFHIYERYSAIDLKKYGNNMRKSYWEGETYTAVSIARIYGNGPEYDICPENDGYITAHKESDSSECGYSDVYYLTSDSSLSNCEYGTTYKEYSTISPLSFDLNNDGVKTSSNLVNFDIDGDGKLDKINDSADAVLVFDKNNDGISGQDGSECFGNKTDLDGDNIADGYKDGFEALKTLAKKEGLIDGKKDNILDETDIKFLEITYGLKIKANGYKSESQTLSELGISQINLSTTDETNLFDNFDGKENQLMTQEGATFIQNGIEKDYADIWHKKK